MLKDWLSLATGQTATSGGSADPLTISWIAENTKDCPKCGTSIEKNSGRLLLLRVDFIDKFLIVDFKGCFMMTCSQCGAQWCWMCSQPWSTHSDHFRCSKYRDAVLEDKPHFSKEELEKRKEKLRYAFYYKQYINHDQSLKLESEQKQKAKTLMEQLVAELPSMDPAFVEDAFLQLQEVSLSH
jgi:ariadne-1